MTERDPGWQAPQRLREDAEIGPLLERGNREFASGLDEGAAFQRLSERIEGQNESRRWHRVSLGAALAFGAALAVAWGAFREVPHEDLAFGPERVTPGSQLAESTPSGEVVAPTPNVEAEAPDEPDEARAARPSEPARLAKPRELAAARLPEAPGDTSTPRRLESELDGTRERATAENTRVAEPTVVAPKRPRQPDAAPADRNAAPEPEAPSPDATRERSSGSAVPDVTPPGLRRGEATLGAPGASAPRSSCLDIAGRDTRAAERCFAERAAGSGLSAEMALYEMARLRRDMLRDALGALDALNDYRLRFPRGSLRHEVDISRIELLSQLGRSREALRESEALLFSPTGRERAAELHVLRGNVFRHDLSDWAAAAREYALAEPFGGALGAEASRLRGQSLEAMGDLPGALAAYRRYLESTAPSARRAEVARRVELLSPKVSDRK